jgi:hypothetical protein
LAFQKLGINPGDVQFMPFVRASLKRIARVLNQDPINLLGSCDAQEARKVYDVYQAVPVSLRRFLPVEAIFTAAGVRPERVIELIAGLAARDAALGAAVVAAIWSAGVVRKTVEMALTDGGVKDRLTLFRAVGFLR